MAGWRHWVISASVALACGATCSADWTRFRGPNGSGVAPAGETVPTEWSDTKNLAWKFELPGPGSSSPIVVGNKVFVTCYSGYGLSQDQEPGKLEDLKRHLVCVDATTGTQVWAVPLAASMPEDPYSRMLGEHGYASGSPVSDGERVYVFYGKGGVLAYDMDGKELWRAAVGTESGPQRWGSGASPILFENLVIVNASEENSALVALDKLTGKEVWKAQADGLGSTWGTPVLVGEGEAAEMVIGVPNEVWGLNPKTGKLKWFAEGTHDQSYCASVVADGNVIYAIDGRGGEGVAIKAGGNPNAKDKDVTSTNTVWRASAAGRISSPIVSNGRVFTTSRGTVLCLDAKTGEKIYQERLPGVEAPAPGAGGPPGGPGGGAPGGPGGGRGGFGGRGGGGMGGSDYASPILVGDKFILVTRSGVTHVWQDGPEFKSLATNKFASDTSRFNGTPAVSGNRLFLRSDKALYCVSAK